MRLLKTLLEYGRDKKGYYIAAMVLSGISTILTFVPFYYFWSLLKEITSNANLDVIQSLAIKIFVTTLLFVFTYFSSLICSHVFAFRLESNLKKEGLNQLLKASFSFFDVHSSGRTRKIIDDNTANTHTVVAHILPDLVNAILFPICVLILSFRANFQIGLLVVAAIVFALYCFKFMFTGDDAMKEYMQSLEAINSETVEYVRGIQVIKVFGLGIQSFTRLYKAILDYSEKINKQCENYKVPWVLYQSCMMSLGGFVILIVYPMIQANHSMSDVVSLVVFFMSFSGLLHTSFLKVMMFSKNFSMAKDTIDKMDNLFKDMKENSLSSGTIKEMKDVSIDFKQVSFGYTNDLPILNYFDLHLEGKKKYALVGPSGSGKSTIAKLMSGFYPIQEGRIEIGGVDLKEYDSTILEKNIAFVFQNAKLFKMSIYDNVKLGNPKASHEQVMDALEKAMCLPIIEKFSTKENTLIGAKGVHLSGGEKQRIAIARAILKDAPIVILDEASAASDPENEYEIQQAFSQLMKEKTVIMIAHRLSSIRNVDEIFFIEDGQVMERGSHVELMGKKGRYFYFQKLYQQANNWRISHVE
ncbi:MULTISPECIES: ABC transporter ATP-binding protein [Terrabacteria group]|uniref:ABC transporter ATP-binding protein n=1 Tax=Bacillati TaxID=1783272 RepID=UPI001C6EC801|nr:MULTISPECIES: ABC transporter ATP-binding protein [Terrabacteria group]MBW9213067.1 ABC transporter ATP-binding protein/permease [Trueperella sp. zg.1013]